MASPHTAPATSLCDHILCHFDHDLPQPNHRQLYGILQTGIRDAALAPGLKLPPTRELAEALGIARNTVVHVYEQLTLEGYVQAGVGRGTYVAETHPRLVADRRPRPTAAAPGRARLSRRGSETVEHAGAGRLQWGAFTPGVPELRMFPVDVWRRLQSQLWRKPTPQQLTYATGHGDPALREAIAQYLQGTRGAVCSPEQVIVTSGTQQSLHLVAHLLADPGDAAWIEDPGYWGARSVFRAAGLALTPVAVDQEGLAPSAEQLRTPPRLMFVSPSNQYPTGAIMSHGRRTQLLDYAAAHGVWIVEDDYDSEFRFRSRPLPALQGLDQHRRVIYLGTFSKTLFPALRLSYLVLPPELVDDFARASSELYREGQAPQQAVLARFLSEGHYATYIRRMRTEYAARHDALIQTIQQRFGDQLPIMGGDAGLHLALGLPQHVDDRAVVEEALQAGVTTRPLSMYYMRGRQPAATGGMLLGYGAVNEAEIGPAFKKLAKVVQRAL
jgi:GntR family transcriptional regulator/MocR family aminotransferase